MVKARRAGIIETFSAGFAVVNRQPWLIGLPALLDLFFWQGPRVGFAPVVQDMLAAYERFVQRNPDLAGATAEGPEQALQQAQEVAAGLAQGDLLHLMAWQFPSLIPSLGAALGDPPAPVWQVGSVPALLLTAVALLLVGLVGTALYLGAVAIGVRETPFSLPRYLGAVRRGWLRLTVFFGILLLTGIPAGFVALLVLGIAGLLSTVLLSLLSTVVLSFFLLVALYLAFADEAIFVGEVGPLGAILGSVAVVARFFWSAIGFLLLSNIIATGLTIVWVRLFSVHPVVAIVVILAHAYIATGLTAAAMVFYRTRTAILAEAQPVRGVPASTS